MLCGFFVACLTFLLVTSEDKLTEFRTGYLQELIDKNEHAVAYIWYAGSGMLLVFFAVILTVYVGPGANGSGVVEVMGLLNGINYPDTIGFTTLLVKVVALTFAITGGLCIGKEGPLVHIGSIIGVITCYLPFKQFKYLQNDVYKRQMMACGAGCGVAVAFGSPIGGALFIYEISKPNTFWTFSMLWRVFTATSIATFTLAILESLSVGSPLSLSDSGSLKLGNLSLENENSILDLPAGIILGVICGLLGALFISVSIRLAMVRKMYINTSIRKVIEAVLFAFITASIFYMIVSIWSDNCVSITTEDEKTLF